MFPLRVHIQLTHLSWPVLITHSAAKLKMIADTRFWWAAGDKRRVSPSRTEAVFRNTSPHWERAEAQLPQCVVRIPVDSRQSASLHPPHVLAWALSKALGHHTWKAVRSQETLKAMLKKNSNNSKQGFLFFVYFYFFYCLSDCVQRNIFIFALKTLLCYLYGQRQIFLKRQRCFLTAD